MLLYDGPPIRVEYFTDCINTGREGRNAEARMAGAVWRELGAPTSFVPMQYPSDGFEAAMTLVDIADEDRESSLQPRQGRTIILGNAAPRATTFGQFPNGREFVWCEIGDTFGLFTLPNRFLSLAHRLGLVQKVYVLNAPKVAEWGMRQGYVTPEQAADMVDTPFRGAKFGARAAGWVLQHRHEVPHERVLNLGTPSPPAGLVARIDTEGFGNAFLDVLPGDVGFTVGGRLQLAIDTWVNCYAGLSDIPPGEVGIVPSSSGYGRDRFLMAALQGGSLEKHFGLEVGDPFLDPSMFARTLVRA
ncbi:MAG TPA: hypothetical protein VMT30_05915 [Candidatus Saccharimonadia bacterium]|nr:hypothetical protein [Candidatus Saccharimonadia bacterium]